MNKFTWSVASLAVLVIGSQALAQSKFKVDAAHSSVVFKVQHVGVGYVWGRFNDPAGTIVWDEQDPSKSKIEATVQASKVDTANAGRDKHLKSPDFFNAAQFPTITFKSTSITKSGDNQYQMVGELTMHGVTKPITVSLTKIGEGERGERFGYRMGIEATFTVKRSEFGMTYGLEGIGDDISVIVNFEAQRS